MESDFKFKPGDEIRNKNHPDIVERVLEILPDSNEYKVAVISYPDMPNRVGSVFTFPRSSRDLDYEYNQS